MPNRLGLTSDNTSQSQSLKLLFEGIAFALDESTQITRR